MNRLPEEVLSIEIRRLLEQESRLAEELRLMEQTYSGLRDVDLSLTLAETRLSLCLQLMRRIAGLAETDGRKALEERIRESALGALRLVEALIAANVSEDQKGIVQASPLYAAVRSRLEEFLVQGGGGYLEARQVDARRRRILSRSVVAAIRKYASVDDRSPALDPAQYPDGIRKALLFLFPVLLRENPEKPPYGIEEGEEVTYSSDNMKLPLSQAILYLEEELIPELERRLAESPGTRSLQEEIRRTRERVEDYRKLRFFPRSTPVLLEKGYYTEGMTGYTVDGEMLVPVPIPVTFRSGTNLDRVMELVRVDVVRRIAGRGVDPEIDEEYRQLKRLESGVRGSSRLASMKLDAVWGYRVLRQAFPFLARLSDKKGFTALVDMVASGTAAAERGIASLIAADQEESRASGAPALGVEPPG
jgi:hypothetical protein